MLEPITMTPHELLNHPLIAARYFFPIEQPLSDATLVPIDAGHLACWRSAPASDRPVVVHFHGNGELVHHWQHGPLADTIAAAGWDLFLAEYRGYGGSDGDPHLATMLDDIPGIADAVGVDPTKIVVFGRSVGSLFAVDWVRQRPTTAGLILESGIFDLHERIALRADPRSLGVEDEATMRALITERIDHARVLGAYRGSTLVLHAERDHLVSIAHAERNAAAARAATFVRFARGDHNSILFANLERYLSEVSAFLSARP